MNEETAAQQYLVDLLENDDILTDQLGGSPDQPGIWLKSRPQDSPLPAVKIDRLESSDNQVIGPYRVWADMTYLVRGIVHWRGSDQPDWTDVSAISDRIDELLQAHEGVNAVVQVHAFREEPFTDETVEAGDLFLHAGGIYRVRAREA